MLFSYITFLGSGEGRTWNWRRCEISHLQFRWPGRVAFVLCFYAPILTGSDLLWDSVLYSRLFHSCLVFSIVVNIAAKLRHAMSPFLKSFPPRAFISGLMMYSWNLEKSLDLYSLLKDFLC